jgi:hypothetical protein
LRAITRLDALDTEIDAAQERNRRNVRTPEENLRAASSIETTSMTLRASYVGITLLGLLGNDVVAFAVDDSKRLANSQRSSDDWQRRPRLFRSTD